MTDSIEFSSSNKQWKFKKLHWWSQFLLATIILSAKICETKSNKMSYDCAEDSDCESNKYCEFYVCSCKQGYIIDEEFQCQPDYFDYFLLSTNLNETYTTSYVNLTTHNNISKKKVEHSLNLLNVSNYNDKYTTNIAHTVDCRNNHIFILRESSAIDDFTKVVDIIHYDNNKYEKIARLFDTFDNATSIAYDWTTNNLYWTEKINDIYSIKRRGPDTENIESIIIPDSEKLFVGKLNIYTKRGIIFWIGTRDIWYASTSSNSSANIFLKTKSQDDIVDDLTIDTVLDRLCWISYNQLSKLSSIYCTDLNAWQPSNTLHIKIIAKNLKGAHGLAIFNNVFYWIASDQLDNEHIYLKNGSKNFYVLKLKVHSQELSIVPSHCFISNPKYNDNNLLYFTEKGLFELTHNNTNLLKLNIQGLTNENNNIAFSSDFKNKIIYILRKSKKNDDKRILDVISYAGYKFKLIDQINDTFDYAESMTYDWMTGNIYWVEFRNQRYAIKVTRSDFRYSDYIIYPDEQPPIKKIHIHSRTKMIFWQGSHKIWYIFANKTNDEKRIFYQGPETKNMTDLAIDLVLDRLCWFSRHTEKLKAQQKNLYLSNLYCINIYGPKNIVKIDKYLNDVRHLAVYNDTYYWIENNNEKIKTFHFKQGTNKTIKLLSNNNSHSGKELIFLISNSFASSKISNLIGKYKKFV